jgi:hypothetical protein
MAEILGWWMPPNRFQRFWDDGMHKAKVARLIDLRKRKIKQNCVTDQ